VKGAAVQAKDNIISAVADPLGKAPEPGAVASMGYADKVASDTLRSAGPADPAQAANTAMQAQARQFVPVTVKAGQELEWLKQNNPDALNRLRAGTGKQAAAADIAQGAASLDRTAESMRAKPGEEDSAWAFSVDQAEKLLGKGTQAVGGAMGLKNVERAGREYAEQQEQDIDLGGYKVDPASLRERYNEEGFVGALKLVGTRIAENWAPSGVTLAGSAAAALAAVFSAPAAAVLAGTTAVGAGLMGVGEVKSELEDQGIEGGDGLAVGAGALIGLLDMVGAGKVIPRDMLTRMTGNEIVTALVEKGYVDAAKAFAKEIGKKAAFEGVTEMAQEGIVMGAAGTKGAKYEAMEIADRLIDGAVIGAAMGGGVGTVSTGIETAHAPKSASAIAGRALLDDVDARSYAADAPPGVGPGEADYRSATKRAFGGALAMDGAPPRASADSEPPERETRPQAARREIEARKDALRGEFGITKPADMPAAEAVDQDQLLGELSAEQGATDGATRQTPAEVAQAGGESGGDLGASRLPAAVVSGSGNGVDTAAGIAAPGVRGDLPAGASGIGVDAVDEAAHEAATSPNNDLREPSEAQKLAGNYKKGKVSLHGLDISIENPAGSTRSGTDEDGKAWETRLAHHYGYVKRTTGADGDQIDVFIGGKPESPHVFVVDQINPKTGAFDEHKALLGFDSRDEALAAYHANYQKGWKGAKAVTELSADQFKDWLKNGDTTKPLAKETDAATTQELAPQAGQAQGAQGLSIGSTPNNAEPVTVKNGIVHVGKYPAMHFETGADVTVPAGADNAAIAQALRDAGVLSSRQRIYGLPKAAKPAAKPVAQPATPATEVRKARAKRAAKSILTADDLSAQSRKTFLKAIKDMGGINVVESRDVAGEPAHIANRMAPGLFRREGNALDLVARRLNELGYLSDADYNDVDGGAQSVRDLIGKALSGESVFTPEEQERYNELAAKEQELAEAVPARNEALADAVEAEATQDDDRIDLDALPTISEADAMGALGFTEEEINGQPDTQSRSSQTAEGTAEGRADEGAAAGAGEAGQAGFALEGQSPADVKAADAKKTSDAEAKTKADAAAEARAKADRERDDFTLTGSSRASDANPGQGDIFSAPKPAEAASASTGADSVSPSETSTAKPEPNQDRLESFGEQVKGRRDSYRKAYGDRMGQAVTEDVAAVPLSKSWPEPDYAKLLEDGADPWGVAFIHAARDEIPAKPGSTFKQSRWVEQVKQLRGLANNILSGDVSAAAMKRLLAEDKFRVLRDSVGSRADLYEAVGHGKSLKGVTVSSGQYGIFEGKEYNPPKVFWSVQQKAKATAFSNWPRMLSFADTREAAIAAFKQKIDGLELDKPADKTVSFDLYSYRGKPGVWIGKKVGKGYIDLKHFDDTKAARAYLADNQAELEALLAKKKEIPNERRDRNLPRVGADHRNGQDVTPETVQRDVRIQGRALRRDHAEMPSASPTVEPDLRRADGYGRRHWRAAKGAVAQRRTEHSLRRARYRWQESRRCALRGRYRRHQPDPQERPRLACP